MSNLAITTSTLQLNDLCKAAKEGNIERINQITQVGKKALIDMQDALHFAVVYRQHETVKRLIELGADVNQAMLIGHIKKDREVFPVGVTPLWCAIKTSNSSIIKILLSNGAIPSMHLDEKAQNIVDQIKSDMHQEMTDLAAVVGESSKLPACLVNLVTEFAYEDLNNASVTEENWWVGPQKSQDVVEAGDWQLVIKPDP